MEFHHHDGRDDVVILKADVEINDPEGSSETVEELMRLVDRGHARVVVDCTDLRFISSAGLGVLLRLHKHAKEHEGEVRLAGAHGPVPDVLKMTSLDSVFGMHPDVGHAVAAFR